MKPVQTLLMVAAATACLAASAQWQWIDSDGRKVFSDRPPPPEIPDANVYKRPGPRIPAAIAARATNAEQPADAASAPKASASKPTGVSKELEAKKKQAQDAEAAKQRLEEERVARLKQENCTRARRAKATFDSGVRIRHTNAAGEMEVMGEAARAEEQHRLQATIDSDCQ